MKKIGLVLTSSLLALAVNLSEAKSDIEMGPILEAYGPTSAIENSDIPLPEGFVYKALFDISETNQKHDQYNRKIESVARFLNMHARNGVKPDNMKLAVVLHGAAVKDILTDEAYAKRHGYKNPNTDLIHQLAENGVKFYVCGQSVAFYEVKKSELSSDVKLALSAMTMAVLLQEDDYQLIPF